MSKYQYSAKNNQAYLKQLSYSVLPDDLVEITEDEFSEFFIEQVPEGKIRAGGSSGKPEWVHVPEPTQEQLHEQWKADRQKQVDEIIVEIDDLLFDGDETSQSRMTRGAMLAASPEEKINWILADNTIAEVTADQLKRAARAAGLEQEKLWLPPEQSQ